MIRDLLLFDKFPGFFLYGGTVAASVLIFFFAYRFFVQYKTVFVDVL